MPMRPPEPRYHYGIGAPKVELRLSGRSCSLAGWSHSNSTWSGHAGLPDSAAQERSTRQATGTWKDLDLGLNRVDGSSNRSRASTLQPSNDVRGLTHQQRPDPIARDRCQRLSDESWTAGYTSQPTRPAGLHDNVGQRCSFVLAALAMYDTVCTNNIMAFRPWQQ